MNPIATFPSTESPVLTGGALLVAGLPLFSFLILFLFGKKLPRQGDWLAIGLTAISFFIATYLFFQIWQKQILHTRISWFRLSTLVSQNLTFSVGIYLDNLAVGMLVLVTFISLLVQIFSVIYMHGEWRYRQYFAYLGLFTFSMLGIILADNLLLLFIFWELVGFSSYLLIGFWFEKESAALASKKAFLFNRVGDFGFLLGIFCLYAIFQTFDIPTLWQYISHYSITAESIIFNLPAAGIATQSTEVPIYLMTLAGLGIFCGCVGKSAQFPLQVWLPDAMEGPTPVSSLIHAATMVAAGVYLLARCFPFFTETTLVVITGIGALTALLGALAALGQYDIKKILAFSTVSQLGYLVMGMGVGALDASLLHLLTHAFFKAALFLNAGIIIHAVQHGLAHYPSQDIDSQDIRNMGGLRKILPVTFYAYLPAAAALIGLPFFSGFLSKDAILTGTWAWAGFKSQGGNYIFYLIPVVGFASVLLTGFYMGKHCFYIFFGQNRLQLKSEYIRKSIKQEASKLLLIPVVLLGVFSLAFFFSVNPFSYTGSWILQALQSQNMPLTINGLTSNIQLGIIDYISRTSYIGMATAIISVCLGAGGIFLAWRQYRQAINSESILNKSLATSFFARVAYHHFYLDNFYQKVLISPTLFLSQKIAGFDKNVLDYGLNNFAKITVILAKLLGWIDKNLVDGIINLLARVSRLVGKLSKLMQNGLVQSYYIFSLVGLLLLVLYILAF